MSDTTLINDVSINGNEGLTPDALSETLQDNTINALGIDASSRTIWVNGQPYGNAYVNVNADNTVDAPLGAEIFNDFEHNVASGEYSGAHGKYTRTTNEAESAFGQFNQSTYGSTIFSIGDGDSDNSRHNIVEVTGNGVNINNALNIEDNLVVDGATTIGGTLGVDSNTTIGGTLEVGSNTTIGGTLGVDSNTTIGGTLEVGSNTTIGGTLGVDSDTNIGGTLEVTGKTTVSTLESTGNVDLKSLDVIDDTTIGGTLEVGSNTTIGGTLEVGSNTTIGGTLAVTGETTVSTLKSTGNVDLESLDVTNNTTIGGALGVDSNTTIGGALAVNGTAYFETKPVVTPLNDPVVLESELVIIPGDGDRSGVMKGAGNSATGKNSLAIGQNNEAISENSVAMGNSNIAGLKGWYYKAVQTGSDSNIVYLYLTAEQQIPIFVSSASAVENQEKNINFNVSKGDICSIINGNRLIDCFEVRLNEMSKYGRISLTYTGEGTNPLVTIQNVEELKLEDYSVFCISKPSYGIVELSKCNIALGNNTKSLAESSVSLGLRSTAAGITTYAEGQDTIAVGECAHAEGAFTKANGIASHTEGFGVQTEGLSAHAEGYNTLATGGASHSEGSATKATGLHSHAEGDTTLASGSQSHAEGKITSATGENSHAEGHWTKAYGKSSHAEGQGISEDKPNLSEGDYSHTEGYSTHAHGTGSHAEGTYTIAEGHRSHAEGNSTAAAGENSHAEGHWTKAYGKSSHAEGQGISEDKPNLAVGDYSHTEGYSTHAEGNASHAEGTYTIASGNRSHSEGNETKAIGSASHAEGYLTYAYGSNSYAGGRETLAFAECSHAEGKGTCTGSYTIDENGNYVFDEHVGSYAHAEGENTIAEGKRSHAEGNTTKALGESSHAEGYNTKAQGVSSHAEGKTTTAAGDYSHTSGLGTQTENNAEFACGKYNKSTKNVTLYSVGIGTSDNDIKNAHEITTDGKHYILGVGNYDGTKLDVAIDVATYLPNMVNITYNKLVTLTNSGQLIPGQQYRITDYVTTTVQENTRIVEEYHQFDIIVTADGVNVLSENARAIQHTTDENDYFSNSDLNAWEVNYCLDNDTSRFTWADTENGKGVIYYMKDERNNECPYDFKNIQFARWQLSNPVGYRINHHTVDDWIQETTPFDSLKTGFYGLNGSDKTFNYGYQWSKERSRYKVEYTISESPIYCYTFGKDTDYSMNVNNAGNVIKEHKYGNKIKLNNIVFLGNFCFNNTFGESCSNNTFDKSCDYNTFGVGCSNNSSHKNLSYNTFANFCYNNTFGGECWCNTFGESCSNNTFGDNSQFNTFGMECEYNSIGYYSRYNTFNNGCYSNIFGEWNSYNTFGTNCCNNTFGDNCSNIIFGSRCSSNAFGESRYEIKSNYSTIIFESDNSYIMLNRPTTSDTCKNVRIGLGVSDQIINIDTNGQSYEMKVAINSNGDVKIYCEADLIA